jgi:hypothetical protein
MLGRVLVVGWRGRRVVGSRWYQLVVDAHDPAGLARWWAEVLGYSVLYESEQEVIIGLDADRYPGIVFTPVPDAKTVKNRLHIDLDPDDHDAEVERIIGLGATAVDVGQGDAPWTVLADPEGNEFDVLTPHRSLIEWAGELSSPGPLIETAHMTRHERLRSRRQSSAFRRDLWRIDHRTVYNWTVAVVDRRNPSRDRPVPIVSCQLRARHPSVVPRQGPHINAQSLRPLGTRRCVVTPGRHSGQASDRPHAVRRSLAAGARRPVRAVD